MDSNFDYSTLFYYSPLPKWVYQIGTYQILEVNQAALDHYKYSKEEFLSMTMKDLQLEVDIQKLITAHKDIESVEGNIHFGVFTHLKKNGERIRMEINGHKIPFQRKNCITVICQDVTEKEKQILELQESDYKLKAASDIAKLGYWRLEMDAQTLSWSDKIYEIFGRSKKDFVVSFESFYNTIHPSDRSAFEKEQDAAFSGERELNFSHRILLPDGKVKWVREMGRLNKDKNGKPVSFEGTVQDITFQKKEEQHLKLLESVITNSNDAVMITEAEPFDEPGPKIIYVNEAFTKMTGYSPDEVIGKTPRILQGPKSDQAELKKLSIALRKWESCEITTINYKKGGEPFWINFSVTPVADEKGWYTHWIAIERDVTVQMNEKIQNNLLSDISKVFNEGIDLKTSLNQLCSLILDYGDFNFSEIWIPNLHQDKLRLFSKCQSGESGKYFYQNLEEVTEVLLGEGLLGEVWKTQNTVTWKDVDNDKTFIRQKAAKISGIKSVVGIPLIHKEKIVGALVVGTANTIIKVKEYENTLNKLKTFVGAEIYRKRLEEDLSNLFEALPDIICVADFTGVFLKMNHAGCKLLEYEEEEIIGKRFDQFVHPADRDISLKEIQKLGKGETTFQFENRYFKKSGEIIWLSWHCNTHNEEGVIYASAKNITKEKKLQELVNDATQMARIGEWELDLINNSLFWSDIIYRLHEVDPDQFRPSLETGINFYREDYRETIAEIINSTLKSGEPFDFEAPIITAKGNTIWVRVIGNAEFFEDKCIRIYGSFQDINRRKLAEIQMKEILGSISDAFYALDKNWNFTYFNKEAENLLGKSSKELIGKNKWEEFPLSAGTQLETIYRRIVKTGVAESFEYYYPGDGSWYEINTYPSQGGVSSYFKNIDDRRKTSEAIRAAYEEKNKILESIGDGFFTMDSNWVVTYWNKTAEKLLNFKREEILGKNLWELFPDAVHLPSYQNYHKVLETKEAISFEDYYGLWFEVNAYPAENGLSVFFRDITYRKEAEDALQKAFEEKTNILESIGDAFFAVDKNWVVTYWNSQAELLLTKKKEDIVGQVLWEVYPDAIDSDFYRQYHRAMQTGESTTFVEYYSTIKKWFEVAAYPNEIGLSVYFKDITLKKESDIRVQQANERFEKVTKATTDAIWDWDIENDVFYRGDGFDDLFGYIVKQNFNQKGFWEDSFHPEDLPLIKKSIEESLSDPTKEFWQQEYRILNRSGETKTVIDKGVIIRNKNGKPSRMVGAITDITEEKNHEIELQKLNKELEKHVMELEFSNEQLEQFAFIASHDLQEPLRMISSFMKQLKRKYGDLLDEKGHQYIHFATDGANRMKQIILDLLEYSRAGRELEIPELIDTSKVIEEYKILRKKIIEDKKVKITYDELPTLKIHQAPYTQIFHCLIDNSIKYSKVEETPSIHISCKESNDQWIFSIKDNGIGISEQFHEKIFVIFQRLHSKEEYEGTGIGLSIVKKHIESWGGRVWLDSKLGKGSTFYFTIKKS